MAEFNGLFEPVPIDDIIVTGIARIEDVGCGLVRVWLYADEMGQRIIKAKIVLPIVRALEMNQSARAAYEAIMAKSLGLFEMRH